MKFTAIIFFFIISSFHSFSQKIITLQQDTFHLKNQRFYVTEVIDKRKNKKYIGELWKGAFKKTDKITVKGGIYNYLNQWFLSNFPKTNENQLPVKVEINQIIIEQSAGYTSETGRAFVSFNFRDISAYKHEIHSIVIEETENAFSSHSQRLSETFRDCARQFNKSIPDIESEKINYDEDALEIVFDNNNETPNEKKYKDKPEKIRQSANRNVIALGYQIGGYTLLGVDYEIRVHDILGLHAGIGLFGYTAGIKIHTNKTKNSTFFNLSWKDTGLGLMNGFAVEAGDRWIWSKKRDFGLYYQGGFLILNHIDSAYEQILYKGTGAPPVSLSLGIGISW